MKFHIKVSLVVWAAVSAVALVWPAPGVESVLSSGEGGSVGGFFRQQTDLDYVAWRDRDPASPTLIEEVTLTTSSELTIYELLKGNPRFSKLIKAIEFDNVTLTHLNDSSADITFFAPVNEAFPHENPKHDHIAFMDAAQFIHGQRDSDKEKIIRAVIRGVLAYHTLPASMDSESLSQNSTFATTFNANDGSVGGNPGRISVIGPFWRGRGGVINYYAELIKVDIRASNGIIHVLHRPLFPPLSALEQAFLGSSAFSIWTSSLQKVNISDEIEYRYIPKGFGLKNVTTAPSVTAFVPVNSAWRKLPRGLQLYLFSPFGERALKKLLQFHIVPNYVLFSEWSFNASSTSTTSSEPVPYASFFGRVSSYAAGDNIFSIDDGDQPMPWEERIEGSPPHATPEHRSRLPHWPGDKPRKIIDALIELPTLLQNHTVTVHILKTASKWLPNNISVQLTAHGVKVALPDLVARNGAIHLIPRVLNPRTQDHPHHPEEASNMAGHASVDEWANWEQWLPAWSMGN